MGSGFATSRLITSVDWRLQRKSQMDGGGRGVSRGMLPLLALHTVSEYYRSGIKPPVTAGLLAANTIIYLRPACLRHIIPNINEVWFNAHLILKYKDYKRFFLSPFYHIGEPHLVYNMLSLLWKGMTLESSMGSVEFASMTAALLCMSQGITLLLSKFLLFFDYERAYYSEYAVGFSGVLFAMKVVLNSQSEEYTIVHGIPVPSKHAAWAELLLIQMFVPGVSFLGHLGGILAGIVYLRLRNLWSGSAPMGRLLAGFSGALSWPLRFMRGLLGFPRGQTYGRGVVGGGPPGWDESGGMWTCHACTLHNSPWLTVCEVCGTSRDDIRRRRIERLGGR